MAMNMFAEGLIRDGHGVKILAVNSFKYHISPGDIPDDYRRKTGIELIDVDLRVRPVPAFLNLFTGKSYHAERFISRSFRLRLAEVLKAESFDIVQLETIFMAPYIDTVRKLSEAKIVLRAHNIEHRIWERIAETTQNPVKKGYIRHLARTLRRFEKQAACSADGIVAITPTDANYFRTLTGGILPVAVPVTDIPFGIDPSVYDPGPDAPEPPALFSIGAMDWIPNLQGIQWFLDRVWPGVHRQFPGLQYHLAGRNMPGWLLHSNLPGVVVHGEVPDARAFMAGKPVMIVPLFSGSGIRIKIIEGMASGRTVISTRTGAEGIRFTPGEHLLIADDPEGFRAAIDRCLNDPAGCHDIGKRARMLAEKEYDARVLTNRLAAFYRQLGE